MFESGYGGTVLLVNSSNLDWNTSLKHPIQYQIQGPISNFQFPQIKRKYDVWEEVGKNANLNLQHTNSEKAAFRDKIGLSVGEARRAIENIATMTRVDGAVILDEDFSLSAFGVKIQVDSTNISDILVRDTFSDSANRKPIAVCGGMRHQSAISFISEQHDCVAVVVSEDKRISIFYWDEIQKSIVQLRSYELIALS